MGNPLKKDLRRGVSGEKHEAAGYILFTVRTDQGEKITFAAL